MPSTRSRRFALSRRSLLAGVGTGLAGTSAISLAPVVFDGTLPETPPSVVGHRGAGGLAPPNTMAAIEAGLDAGVDGIELDVWQTLDGELLLFHDAVLDWESTAEGLIEATTWDEIDGETIGGEPLIRLPRALDRLAETDVDIYLELKAAGFAEAVIETVTAYGLRDRLTLISFDQGALEPVLPLDVPIGVVGTVPSSGLVEAAVDLGAESVFSHYAPHAVEPFVDEAATAGLTSGIWKLLETSGTLHDSLEAGPEVFVTNYPDQARALLERT